MTLLLLQRCFQKLPTVISSSLFVISGYSLYLNFNPDNHNPLTNNIHGVEIFVSKKLASSQAFVQFTSLYKHHVWATVKLRGSDSFLIGGIYHSSSCCLSTSVESQCNLLSGLDITIFICKFVEISTLQKFPGLNCQAL